MARPKASEKSKKDKKAEKKEEKVEKAKQDKKAEKKEEKVEKAKQDKKAEKKEEKVEKAKQDKKAEKAKKKAEKKEEIPEKTLEEELEEQLTDEEIENFQIEKVDMEKLTNRVCLYLANFEDGIVQSELWKKFKLTSRDGSRLALKLERMGIITREKILENKRWTYVLKIKKTPVSTESIENAPCLVCPVEQKCSLDGEVSPRTCQWIEDWALAELSKPKKKKEQ
ncbi:MAG: transcriptional regulator [Candidatus Nitrosotenuis sp.]